MVAFTATEYLSPTDFKTAVAAIENTVTIHVFSYMEAGKQKFMLVA